MPRARCRWAGECERGAPARGIPPRRGAARSRCRWSSPQPMNNPGRARIARLRRSLGPLKNAAARHSFRGFQTDSSFRWPDGRRPCALQPGCATAREPTARTHTRSRTMQRERWLSQGSGLRVARRALFGLVAGLGLGALARGQGGQSAQGMMDGPPEPLDLDAFLAEAVPLAKDLIGDTSRAGQDRYLHALASLAACIGDLPIPEMRENTGKTSPAKTFIGANGCDAPFSVLHWRMEPGARIGLHPHIYGNVVTLCLEGEVRIENYEMVRERDFDTTERFPVRRTNDQMLQKGGINLVSLEHGYVHGFEAGPAGARGLDITTRIRQRRETPSLVVGPALEPERRIFEGRWQNG